MLSLIMTQTFVKITQLINRPIYVEKIEIIYATAVIYMLRCPVF